MPDTAPALPESLPPHAVAECEADPSMVPFWTRWAAVGDAKDAQRQAQSECAAAEVTYFECRAAAAAKVGRAIPSGACGCGACLANVRTAVEVYEDAKAAVAAAIEEFKS
jgi:hypothetical protein